MMVADRSFETFSWPFFEKILILYEDYLSNLLVSAQPESRKILLHSPNRRYCTNSFENRHTGNNASTTTHSPLQADRVPVPYYYVIIFIIQADSIQVLAIILSLTPHSRVSLPAPLEGFTQYLSNSSCSTKFCSGLWLGIVAKRWCGLCRCCKKLRNPLMLQS